MLLSPAGKPVSDRERTPTPGRAHAASRLTRARHAARTTGRLRPRLRRLSRRHQARRHFDRRKPPSHWDDFPLQNELEKRWRKPVRVANDAAVQGYGAIKGEGVEIVITLGTGMGSALFTDGKLARSRTGSPPLARKNLRGLPRPPRPRQVRQEAVEQALEEAIEQTAATFNWDHLYLGGGNTKKIIFKLPKTSPSSPTRTASSAAWRCGGKLQNRLPKRICLRESSRAGRAKAAGSRNCGTVKL